MPNLSSSERLFEVVPAVPNARKAYSVFVHPPLPYEIFKVAGKHTGMAVAKIGEVCTEFVLSAPSSQQAAEKAAEQVVGYLIENDLKAIRADFVEGFEGITPFDEHQAA